MTRFIAVCLLGAAFVVYCVFYAVQYRHVSEDCDARRGMIVRVPIDNGYGLTGMACIEQGKH